MCFNMKHKLKKLSLVVVLGISLSLNADKGKLPIDQCLNKTSNMVKDCVGKLMTKKSITSCYKLVDQIYSNTAKERLKEYCFFEVNEFQTLNQCISSAVKFFDASTHDEGLFECYQQFGGRINTNTCISIADKMTYESKKLYLKNQCYNR